MCQSLLLQDIPRGLARLNGSGMFHQAGVADTVNTAPPLMAAQADKRYIRHDSYQDGLVTLLTLL